MLGDCSIKVFSAQTVQLEYIQRFVVCNLWNVSGLWPNHPHPCSWVAEWLLHVAYAHYMLPSLYISSQLQLYVLSSCTYVVALPHIPLHAYMHVSMNMRTYISICYIYVCVHAFLYICLPMLLLYHKYSRKYSLQPFIQQEVCRIILCTGAPKSQIQMILLTKHVVFICHQ